MDLECNHVRSIAHFDLDAFYVACERELNPALLNRPVAVSQYNPYGNLHETHSSQIHKRLVAYPKSDEQHTGTHLSSDKNGSMIAVSYEARSRGVKRGDRGLDALKKCPELFIVQVPVKRGKADLTMYRNASHRIMETLYSSLLSPITSHCDCDDNGEINISESISGCEGEREREDWIGQHVLKEIRRGDIKVEKASIDEIYIDLSLPVNMMARHILHLQKSRKKLEKPIEDDDDDDDGDCATARMKILVGIQLWDDVLQNGRNIGCTTIGGIESLSNYARAATRLSKNEVRKGSSFQVLEQSLDEGSNIWWSRPLQQWTDIEIRLACASALATRARKAAEMKFETVVGGKKTPIFTLSGGISSNKTLAKLASGLKKPNRQTLINALDSGALSSLFHPLKIDRIRGLGGKFGESVAETLGISTVGDLAKVPLTTLQDKYPPSIDDDRPVADFLYTIAKGVCKEDVSERTTEKSMSSGKTFRGALALNCGDENVINKWLSELVGGLLERLTIDYEENMRLPSILVLSMKVNGVKSSATSRSIRAPPSLSHEAYLAASMRLYRQYPITRDGNIHGITCTASNFNKVASGESSIVGAFQRSAQMTSQSQRTSSPKLAPSSAKSEKSPLLDIWKKSRTHDSNDFKRRKFMHGNGNNLKSDAFDFKLKDSVIGADQCSKSATSTSTPNRSTIINGIDQAVLSQLPASIQSEIRVASMLKIGSAKKTKKRSGGRCPAGNMKNWLKTKNNAGTKPEKSSFFAKKSSQEMQHKMGKAPRRIEIPQDYLYNGGAGIDTKVFAELPFHIQALVRKEMRATKMKK